MPIDYSSIRKKMWTHKLSFVLFVAFISFLWADAHPLYDEDSLNDDNYEEYPLDPNENKPYEEPTDAEYDLETFFDKVLDGQDVTKERQQLAEYRRKHPVFIPKERTLPPPEPDDIDWEE